MSTFTIIKAEATAVEHSVVDDKLLDAEALGVLVWIFRQDGDDIEDNAMMERFGMRPEEAKHIINELTSAGYISVEE